METATEATTSHQSRALSVRAIRSTQRAAAKRQGESAPFPCKQHSGRWPAETCAGRGVTAVSVVGSAFAFHAKRLRGAPAAEARPVLRAAGSRRLSRRGCSARRSPLAEPRSNGPGPLSRTARSDCCFAWKATVSSGVRQLSLLALSDGAACPAQPGTVPSASHARAGSVNGPSGREARTVSRKVALPASSSEA
jgi:hypothetical protein